MQRHVQRLQPEGFHGKEIPGQELLLVVGHQMSPAEGAIANGCGQAAVPISFGHIQLVAQDEDFRVFFPETYDRYGSIG
jgi:hypothetical protein